MHFKNIAVAMLTLLAVVAMPLVGVKSAGGGVAGKVTDPKGAVVVGATVTVTDATTNQSFTALTDAGGKYKVEGLPPGTYRVTVSATGFADALKDSVRIEEGVLVAADFQLELAAIEATVDIVSKGLTPNSDPVYQQLRRQARGEQEGASEFTGSYATVNGLVLNREGAEFRLRTGEIYFLAPIVGRYTGAVFIGDGELSLVPPTDVEKNSLKIFTGEPALTEKFSNLILHFTDKTFDEIKSSPNVTMGQAGSQSAKARSLFRDNQDLLRKQLRINRELRTLVDLYAPELPGHFNAFIEGKRFSKLVFVYDPFGAPFVAPEEVLLRSYGETDGGYWTAYHRPEEHAKGTASSSEDHRVIDITHHEIKGSIKGTQIKATDKVTFRVLATGTRVVPFELYPSLRVSRVQDDQGKDLNFIQERKEEDADFGVIMPKALEAGKTYELTVHYAGGDALRDSGNGNFILIPRSTWYPANANTLFAEDRATFDMTFNYPKGYTFVGTGAPEGAETRDGDFNVARWTSGKTELAVAGFNYGRFKKKEVADKESGYNIEFYANQDIPDDLRRVQLAIERAETAGIQTETTLGSISTTRMADSALADAQNATRIYNLYFGKLPYTRLAMTQQPAPNFGQAWPTLVYMPYTAFLDTTQRTQLFGIRGGTDNFWRYVAPHEIAHQWWGHIIGWDSYHDQWMSEGFAEFSASLYVQTVRGYDKFIDFWEDQRSRIVNSSPQTKDRKPFTIGPVTQGYRLNNAKTGNAAQALIYPKGAYILHMLRMMMFDPRKGGDARFQTMMKDFIQTHFNQDVSTEDLQRSVEKHITKEMDIDGNSSMKWFFDQWVYGTEVPAYKFEYQFGADGSLSGRLTQSGVSDKFVMLVPVYVDFGKGWARLGMATIQGNSSVELKNIKLPPGAKGASICAMNDVLATSIQNSK
jgi:Carboxypeptidase regulatory-like domain/Peptidase family M1 domain